MKRIFELKKFTKFEKLKRNFVRNEKVKKLEKMKRIFDLKKLKSWKNETNFRLEKVYEVGKNEMKFRLQKVEKLENVKQNFDLKKS
ncbi:MAG: hypothetical protein EAZ97_02155 [Bacteroidetes bacterium]|nr:MAG: hypothetical protein EAZ97_02155 [Bacteroidota bacterium]